ncbi:hypothetical protein Pan44_23220 [Caulifigura coniformis]|uniref:Uncharacterized protein n=1 Tax=Caulifigura coniformis TaxID=2527983 RepID=A0A517SDU2_9PLAN|nr:HNH endonuclease [Caulifigura coniformis]QDT54294.1 hypothetical protein Pan44_23220 [Caulifigura coniformis]
MEKWWIEAQLRDGGRCVYCGLDLYATFGLYYSTQGDHLIPRSTLRQPELADVLRNHDVFRGGPVRYNSVSNCVTTCVFCNQHKGKALPDGWERMTREELIDWNRRELATVRSSHEREYERRVAVLASRQQPS